MAEIKGVITPILTPFNADGSLADDLWVAHANWVLGQGAHFLSPFGTTGEAASVSLAERRRALEVLVSAGVPAERLIPGTGLCALAETVELSCHARDLGVAGVMTLPPFFYTGASEDGLVRYFEELVAETGTLPIVLYHIPSHAGVGVSPSLAARLNEAMPEVIVGYKDSGGQWENTQAVIDAAPGLRVFPGSEAFLTQGLAAGGVGCISATCNVNAGQIRALYDGWQAGADVAALDAEVKAMRKAVQDAGLIPAMKALLAARLGEPRWLNVRAPLMAPDAGLGTRLAAALGPAVAHIAA